IPRARSSWATTAGTPAARSRSAIRVGSCGAMRHDLGMKEAPPGVPQMDDERPATRGAYPCGRASPRESPAAFVLLLLFSMHRVLAKPGAEFAELQLLPAHLAAKSVVVIAGLVAHEEHRFDLLLAFAAR